MKDLCLTSVLLWFRSPGFPSQAMICADAHREGLSECRLKLCVRAYACVRACACVCASIYLFASLSGDNFTGQHLQTSFIRWPQPGRQTLRGLSDTKLSQTKQSIIDDSREYP